MSKKALKNYESSASSNFEMFRVLRFGLKAGLAASAVYLTVDNGVWKDSETTSRLYDKIETEMKPYVKPYVERIPFDFDKIPKTGDVISTGKVIWNKGVAATFLFLTQIPDLSLQYGKEGIQYLYNTINEQIQTSKNESNSKEEAQTKL